MKNTASFWSCISLFCWSFLAVHTAAGQSKNDLQTLNKWAAKPLSIDGNLGDWGDSLAYKNEGTRFSFEIRNDGEMLYLALRSNSKENLNRILARGISFSLNAESRKKHGPTIIFPLADRSSLAAKPLKQPVKDEKQLQQQILSRINKVNVRGFAEIPDGPVSLQNTYGISSAAGFDKENNLTIEIAVPFALLGIGKDQAQIACLIEMNGVKQARSSYDPNRSSARDMYGYPSRDYRYDRRPAIDKQSQPVGFWIRSTIAKKA